MMMRRSLWTVSVVVACTVGLVACNQVGDVQTDPSGANAAAVARDRFWRVLADEYSVGGDPAVHVATTPAEYEEIWSALGFPAPHPPVETEEEVVIAFSVSYAPGCEFPFVSLDVDHTAGTISPRYVGNEPAECGPPDTPYTAVLAISRDGLTAGIYEVRLTAVHPDIADATAQELRQQHPLTAQPIWRQ